MAVVEPTLDDALIVARYRLHWIEMEVAEREVRDDWREQAVGFLRRARLHDRLEAFAAVDGGAIVGSACCQLAPRTFPAFRKADALRNGYFCGLYVRPADRGRGVGRMLVTACMSHLRSLGCGHVLLHSGALSAPLYGKFGFQPTHELGRPLA